MEKSDVITFFDRLAPSWDAEIIRSEEIISRILENAGVTEGKDILDVACGTGVLLGDYLKHNVSSVTAIDISPEMVKIARSKGWPENVHILCGDVETANFERLFDCVVVYNAFPHFPDPERLIAGLSQKLRPGGILTVAHGMSRAAIDAHHKGAAHHVSNGLMEAEELADIFRKYLHITCVISDASMYQVVGQL